MACCNNCADGKPCADKSPIVLDESRSGLGLSKRVTEAVGMGDTTVAGQPLSSVVGGALGGAVGFFVGSMIQDSTTAKAIGAAVGAIVGWNLL